MEKFSTTITVLGPPQAQKRHRHFAMHKGVTPITRTYDPSSADKKDFLSLIRKHAPETPINGPVCMEVQAFFDRPKSHFGTGKNSNRLKDNAPDWHTSKPDGDNVFKFVSDSMKGIYYRDDCQIVSGTIEKHYSISPRVEIRITEL